jgi:selenide, water dikinase
LVACEAARAESIRAAIEDAGYPRASIIGSVAHGDAVVRVA